MGFGTLGYSRLDVIRLDPFGQPPQIAIAIEGIGSDGQMGDGALVVKRFLGQHGDVVAVEAQDAQIFQPCKGRFLDTLQPVVANDESSQPAQIGKDKWWQDGDVVVAQIPGTNRC